MITATSRRCGACFAMLDDGATSCAHCGRALAPLLSEWPAGAKRFLCLLLVADALGVKLEASEQAQYERLLENAIRGRWYSGQLIPHAALAAECYPQFVTLLERWQAQGSPTEFAAIAQLRGPR